MNRRYACRILAVGMPAAVAVSALFPVTAGWFFADDFYWLQFAGSAGSSPVDLLTHRFFNYYRPVINCLFRLEYTWAHLNAAPRYVLNLVMYAASTGLLVAWLNRLTGRIPIAVATGVLFGLGARHVEAVTWISGRTDLTAVLFFLTAMLLIPPLEAFPSPQRASGRFRTCLSVAALICAGLSKETPVVTPLIIYLVDRRESPVHPRLLHWFHSRMPWIATGIALTVLHTVMQSIGNVAWTRLGPPITLMGAAKNLIGGTALAALQNVPSWFRWDGNGWIACSILALVAAGGAWIQATITGSGIDSKAAFRHPAGWIPTGFVMTLVLMAPTAAVPFPLLPDLNLTFGRFLLFPAIGMAVMTAGLLGIAVTPPAGSTLTRIAGLVIIGVLAGTGWTGTRQTVMAWVTLTGAHREAMEHVRGRLAEEIPPEAPVIVLMPDPFEWPEMFDLFAGRPVTVVRNPPETSVVGKHIYLFEHGRFQRIERKE